MFKLLAFLILHGSQCTSLYSPDLHSVQLVFTRNGLHLLEVYISGVFPTIYPDVCRYTVEYVTLTPIVKNVYTMLSLCILDFPYTE